MSTYISTFHQDEANPSIWTAVPTDTPIPAHFGFGSRTKLRLIAGNVMELSIDVIGIVSGDHGSNLSTPPRANIILAYTMLTESFHILINYSSSTLDDMTTAPLDPFLIRKFAADLISK